MRHNDEIHWKDQAAFAALSGLIIINPTVEINEDQPTYEDTIAKAAYRIAEAMFAEREKDEHNPTEQPK